MAICSSEQMEAIRRGAVRLTKHEILEPLEVVGGLASETDSSDEMEIYSPDSEGMIRLQEVPVYPTEGDNLTLSMGIIQ